MKVIVAGSCTIDDPGVVFRAIELADMEIDEVVVGGARGVDTIAHQAAVQAGLETRVFEPDWDRWGRSAGPRRNRQMAEYADALIAVWDGASRGTRNMIKEARARGLEVFVFVWGD